MSAPDASIEVSRHGTPWLYMLPSLMGTDQMDEEWGPAAIAEELIEYVEQVDE